LSFFPTAPLENQLHSSGEKAASKAENIHEIEKRLIGKTPYRLTGAENTGARWSPLSQK